MLQTISWRKPNLICAACILLSVLFALLLGACATDAQDAAVIETADGILRLHVIANSDSAADQAVKLHVRDAILACMEPGATIEEAETFVREHGDALLRAAEETLRAEGFDYTAQLMLGQFDFPDRTYGDTLYPAGEYEALRVVLGSGGGQNWWCVLFPPLCIVTEDIEELPDMEDLTFKSSILEWLRSLGVIS